jgi:hypothetical protein
MFYFLKYELECEMSTDVLNEISKDTETRNQNNQDAMKFITHVLLTMNLHHQWENETRKRGIVLIDSTVYGS